MSEYSIQSRFLEALQQAEEKARIVKEELPERKQQLRKQFREARAVLADIKSQSRLQYVSEQEAEKLLLQIAEEEIQKVGQEWGLEFSKGDIASILF